MEFYNNKQNDSLKFKINVQGINTDKVEARLVLKTSENLNQVFFGKISNDICTFDIPELKLYENKDKGTIKFEMISEDLYFSVWEDSFEIKTKASIKVDEVVYNKVEKEPSKPKVEVSQLIKETRKEPEIKQKTPIRPEIKQPTKINKSNPDELMDFNKFFNK